MPSRCRTRTKASATSIAQLTGQARSDIALALRLAAPARVTVRFHPTTASYERATGKPWFTSGAIVGGELHLVPLASLRERGVLERTIRHELVHLMADPVLRERAAWVREGAAIYFAGWGPVPGDARPTALSLRSRLACPGDADLLRPVSPGSLSNALAQRARLFFPPDGRREVLAGREVELKPRARRLHL